MLGPNGGERLQRREENEKVGEAGGVGGAKEWVGGAKAWEGLRSGWAGLRSAEGLRSGVGRGPEGSRMGAR